MGEGNGVRATEARRPRQDTGFGSRIKQFRRDRSLTLQQLANQSGLAVSTISKVEQGQLSPTYENILKLANGLQVDVAELFNANPNRMTSSRRSVTRAGQGDRLNSPQYDYEMLCADLSNKQFIPLLTTLKAHSFSEFPGYIQHAGEEFIYIMSGQVELRTDSYAPLLLGPGDSCYFDSTMGHACLSVGDSDAVILWVCSQVSFPTLEREEVPAKPVPRVVGPLAVTRPSAAEPAAGAQDPQTAR
jgi:transcriptional regulator with XRE-family HTH domain